MLKLERFRLRSFINSMNNVKLHSDGIFGEITVPSSKSFAHRALIVAALSGKKITIHNIIFSDDIKATINALENLGVVIKVSDDSVIVDGSGILRNSFVKINANDVVFKLSNEKAGTLDGFTFTGSESSKVRTVYVRAILKANLEANCPAPFINIIILLPINPCLI